MNDVKRYLRIFDANLNRSREGIRVIEDTARFVLGDKVTFKKLRSLRHKLDKITREIYPELVSHRDTISDAGRSLKESRRRNFESIIRANSRRAEESLRVLEEYSKLLVPSISARIKFIRFELYKIEKKLIAKN